MKNLLSHSSRITTLIGIAPITFAILATMIVAAPYAHAANPNVTVNVTPNYLCTNPGISARYMVSISSVDGFVGSINLSDKVDPSGPTVSALPSSVSLNNGQTKSFDLIASSTTTTPSFVYTITVTALSGIAIHSASANLVVTADCSVGGALVPTAIHSTTTPYLVYGISIAALLGVVAAATIVYVNRRQTSP